MNQQISLPLEKMTVTEKLEVMELLWADLRRTSEMLPTPEWHKELLANRRKAFVNGETGYTDWETAKQEIRNRVS